MHSSGTSLHLTIFSDDWGRHPSSMQHLAQQLQLQTLWVNTIGTRKPRLNLHDFNKIARKLKQWSHKQLPQSKLPDYLEVIAPPMYPGFRNYMQRKLNAKFILAKTNLALQRVDGSLKKVGITTLPITCDLPGKLNVDHWLYYNVDDFSVWPGADGKVLRSMHEKMLEQADRIICTSQTLYDQVQAFGKEAKLVTHGIDIHHWHEPEDHKLPAWWPKDKGPKLLFWGLIDERLDINLCLKIARHFSKLILVGPHQSVDPRLKQHPLVHMPGSVEIDLLPTLAQHADALLMPYADLPVTRAMQPLKFKEYLATGKPVVASRLPATTPWEDAAYLPTTPKAWIQQIDTALKQGTTSEQLSARERLNDESWEHKAEDFMQVILEMVS